MKENNKNSWASERKFKKLSIDESGDYIIYREYTERKFPIKIPVSPETPWGKIFLPQGTIKETIKETRKEPRIIFIEKPSTRTLSKIKILEIISNLEKLIEDIKENFDDIRDRQIFFFKFKENINELWKVSKGKTKKIALRLEYAIKNLKSEKLTKEQIDALEKAIIELKVKGEKGKKEIQKILLDAKIFTIPKIEGLTEMYLNQNE